jgi:hypothetical protein
MIALIVALSKAIYAARASLPWDIKGSPKDMELKSTSCAVFSSHWQMMHCNEGKPCYLSQNNVTHIWR